MRLVSLNIGGYEFLSTAIPWLERTRADVFCLQEVMRTNLPQLQNVLGMPYKFVAQASVDNAHFGVGPPTLWGLAIFARQFTGVVDCYHYAGDPLVEPHCHGKDHSRWLLTATAYVGGHEFRISNIQAPWAVGSLTPVQFEAAHKISRQLGRDSILCGDFNVPLSSEVMTVYRSGMTSGVPLDCRTTVDPNLHRKRGLHVACDDVMVGANFVIEDLTLHFDISDHAGLMATIERR